MKKTKISNEFKKQFKDLMNVAKIKELYLVAQEIDKCENLTNKCSRIKQLIKDIMDLSKREDHLIESAKTLLPFTANWNYVRKADFRRKIQTSENKYFALVEYNFYLYKVIKELEKIEAKQALKDLN